MGGGNVVSAIFERGADAVTALTHGCVGQADGVKVILIALDARAIDFHLNDVGIDSVNRGAERFIEHISLRLFETEASTGFLQTHDDASER